MTTSRYVYQPLDSTLPSVRLLTLSSSGADGELRLSIENVKLEMVINSFSAVSYVWGNDEPSKRVWINGAWMMLRENIWRFLKHCQASRFAEKAPSHLWIDAICIDQQNTTEKEHQVRMMGDIYASAQQTLVWLGTASENTNFATAWKNYRQMDPEIRHRSFRDYIRDRSTPDSVSDFGEPYFSHGAIYKQQQAIVDDLWAIRTATYWQRLWVVQEIFLAKRANMILGADTASYNHWSEICSSLTDEHPDSSRGAYNHTYSTFLIQSELSGEPVNLLTSLQYCREKQCSDIRDKIYGLLGLGRGHYTDKLMIDYTCTTGKLAKRALTLIIEEMVNEVAERPIREQARSITNSPTPIPAYWLQTALGLTDPEFVAATSLLELTDDLIKAGKEKIEGLADGSWRRDVFPYFICLAQDGGGRGAPYIDESHPLFQQLSAF